MISLLHNLNNLRGYESGLLCHSPNYQTIYLRLFNNMVF